MESIMFLSCNEVREEDLATHVSEMGGQWNSDPTLNHGVITKGSSAIYCNRAKPASCEYSAEELVELANRMGCVPKSVVVIDIGHGQESASLALLLADRLLQAWGGLIDDNGVL